MLGQALASEPYVAGRAGRQAGRSVRDLCREESTVHIHVPAAPASRQAGKNGCRQAGRQARLPAADREDGGQAADLGEERAKLATALCWGWSATYSTFLINLEVSS